MQKLNLPTHPKFWTVFFNGHGIVPAKSCFGFIANASLTLTMLNNFATLKPKEFLSDFCKAAGLVVNFKLDGDVWIDFIGDYFDGTT